MILFIALLPYRAITETYRAITERSSQPAEFFTLGGGEAEVGFGVGVAAGVAAAAGGEGDAAATMMGAEKKTENPKP